MEDETSDILGTHKLPIVRGSPSSRWSFGVNTIFVFASIIALYVVGRRLWKNLLVWREKSYKLYVSVIRFFFFRTNERLIIQVDATETRHT